MTADLLRREIAARLRAAGVDNAAGEAAELLRHYLGLAPADLLMGREIAAPVDELERAVRRRCSGVPLQYILGEWEFCGRRILCREGVLIPRGDTEHLALCAVDYLRGRREARTPLVLDLCCGSGAVGLTVAAESGAGAVLTDIAPEALALAADNARLFGVSERVRICKKNARTDYCFDREELPPCAEGTEQPYFNAVLSNPPYIPTGDIAALDPTVADFEPLLALDGGADGLDFYRILAARVPALLRPGGLLALEVGIGQDADVASLLRAAGFEQVSVIQDYAGIGRVVRGLRPPACA